MRLDPEIASAYAHRAFDRMLEVAEVVGAEGLNERPHGPGTNSVGALIIHCAGVCEFWLGYVALGRPSDRDRDREFESVTTLYEVRTRVAEAQAQVDDDLRALAVGKGHPSEVRELLPAGGDDDDVVLHVFEELFQHVGHMELAADAWVAKRS